MKIFIDLYWEIIGGVAYNHCIGDRAFLDMSSLTWFQGGAVE